MKYFQIWYLSTLNSLKELVKAEGDRNNRAKRLKVFEDLFPLIDNRRNLNKNIDLRLEEETDPIIINTLNDIKNYKR